MRNANSVTRRLRNQCLGGLVCTLAMTGCGLAIDNQDRLVRGQAALESGDYRAAIIDARNILQNEPENVAARVLLGEASVAVGDGVTAEKELRRAVEFGVPMDQVLVGLARAMLQQQKFEEVVSEIQPDMAASDADRLEVLRLRGDAQLASGQPAAARQSYTQVLADNAGDVEAMHGVAISYISERNFDQARENLNQLLAEYGQYLPAWLTSGSLAIRARQLDRAESDFRTAVQLASEQEDRPRQLAALAGLGETLLVMGNVDEARTIGARMAELAPDDTRTLLISARLDAADGNWLEAQQDLQTVLRRFPDHREAQMLLGLVHKESGDLGQAEMYLSAVVAAVPNNANARRLLAETRLEMNKAEMARETLEPIVSMAGAESASLSMAAGASISLGQFDDAIALLRRGVEQAPSDVELKLQLAFALLRSGAYDESRALLNEIREGGDANSEFLRDGLLVLAELAEGGTDAAIERGRQLLERWPELPGAHNLVGVVAMSAEDYAAARRNFDDALKLEPDNTTALHWLAQLDLLDDDTESARSRYLLILELEPDDVRSMVGLARIAAGSEDQEEARRWLEEARSSDLGAIEPRKILASIYLRSGDYADAERLAKEALNLDDSDARLHDVLGVAQLFQRNYRAAAQSFAAAVSRQPDEPVFRLNLARAQVRMGEVESALQTLRDSIDRGSGHPPTRIMFAALKIDRGELQEARRVANALLAEFPDDPSVRVLEAELLFREGNESAAAAAYDRILEGEPSQRYAVRAFQIRSRAGLDNQVGPLVRYLDERPLDSNMRVYLAQAYEGAEQIDRAITEYERVLSQDPENFVAANNLALHYFSTGDSRAVEFARKAHELVPDNPSVLDTLGWILVNDGELDEGIEFLRQAVQKSDGAAEHSFHLAKALVQSGEDEEARRLLTRILAKPEPFDGRDEAEELLGRL